MATMSGMAAIADRLIQKNVVLPIAAEDAPPLIGAIEQNLIQRKKRNGLWLPNLADTSIDTILVGTDFGGEHQTAKFNTYSFLFAGYQLLAPTLNAFKMVRQRHGLVEPFREVCFKEFRYGPIGRCIPDWLKTADAVTGLLFTLVVPKTAHSVIGPDNPEALRELSKEMEKAGFPGWHGKDAEKALRIVHVLAYFLGLLSRTGQNVVWFCDQDSVFANAERIKQMQKLLALQLSKYGHGQYGNVAIGLPFEKTYDKYSVCELLSIPDLAAGSIERILVEEQKGPDACIRLQANSVLLWLTYDSVFLKKLTTHVRTAAGGALEVASTVFIPIDHTPMKSVVVGRSSESVHRTLKHLQTKIALSNKYRRLARKANSRAKRRTLATKAKKYERQASRMLWG